MSLIVSRRGNVVSPRAGMPPVLVARQPRRVARQRGTQQGARQPTQLIVQAAPSTPSGTGRRRRRRAAVSVSAAPIAYGGSMGGGYPAMRASSTPGTCGVVISHTEVIDSINGSTSFSGIRYPMVPAIFSWLNGVGRNFSRFRWLSLKAEFVTASPTSQGGSIAMGAIYDSEDQFPDSITEMMGLAHSHVAPVWSQPGLVSHRTVFDPTRWSKPWYPYGSGGLVGVSDTYSPAFLLFGRETQVNGQLIGHLVVTYSIEMVDPIPANINIGGDPTVLEEKETDPKTGITRWLMPSKSQPKAPDPLDRLIEALASSPLLGLGITSGGATKAPRPK
nr:MAG: putative coat protein [Barnaviridae sp.]